MKKWRFLFTFGLLVFLLIMLKPGVLQAQEYADSRALIISRGDYDSPLLNLTPGPENDAKNFGRVLEQAYGNKIQITRKEKDGVTTTAGVTQAIRQAFGASGKGSVNYFYYTGHGSTTGLYLGKGTMPPAELAQAFEGIKGTNILVLDCCFSGGMISRSGESSDAADSRTFSEKFIEEFADAAAALKRSRSALTTGEFHVITASSEEEEAWQGNLGEEGAPIGLFSGSLSYGCGILPGKVNKASGYEQNVLPADYDQNGTISFNEICLFIQNQVYSSNMRRYPQYDEGTFLPGDRTKVPDVTIQKAGVILRQEGQPVLSLAYLAKQGRRIEFSYYKGSLWSLSSLMKYCAAPILPAPNNLLSDGQGSCQVLSGSGTAEIPLNAPGREMDSGNYVIMVKGENYNYMLPFVIPGQEETVLLKNYQLTAGSDIFNLNGQKEICITADFGREKSEETIRPYITAVVKDAKGNFIRSLGEDLLADTVSVNGNYYKFYQKFYWDGKDSSGVFVKPGEYQIKAEARIGMSVSSKTVAIRLFYEEGLDLFPSLEEGMEETETKKPGIQVPDWKDSMPQKVKISSISLNINGKKVSGRKVVIGLKEKLKLKSMIHPSNASQKKVTWRSSDKKILSVSVKGVIKGKKTGTARVTVSADGVRHVLAITVRKAPVQIYAPIKKKTLKKGQNFKIKTTIPGGRASFQLSYISSNPKVAAVDRKGRITGRKKGKAAITVKTFNGKNVKIRITVK